MRYLQVHLFLARVACLVVMELGSRLFPALLPIAEVVKCLCPEFAIAVQRSMQNLDTTFCLGSASSEASKTWPTATTEPVA